MAGIAEQLRQTVLQAAIQGKLTEQLPEDGDAKDLLAEIQAEKAKLITEKRTKRENPLETIAKDEGPFDVSNSWSWAKLGDLCLKIGAGNTPPGGKNSDVYKTDGIKFIRSMNVYNDGLHYEGMVYISEELASKRAGSAVIAKDMLLNITGGSIGRCAIVPNDFDIGNVNQHVLIIRCVNEQCRSYIHLVICSPLIQAAINEKAVGDKAGFSANKAKNLLIPLPPLAEQHRIVARVDELMAKIDELEKVENELNALHKAFPGDMKAALLQAAMQGKLTEQLREDGNVDELLLAIEKERNELIAKKEIKKDDLENLTDIPFDVPESWRWVKLNNIVIKNIKRGKSPTYAPNSHILVFAQKCNTKAGYINMDLALFLDEDKAKKYPNSEYMQDADTVINSTGNGTLGRVGFYRESDNPRHFPVVSDSHVTVVRTSSKLNKKYVMYCLKYFQPYFEKKCTGSTNQTELGVDIVKNLPFPVPPIKEQQRIVEKLDKLLPLCDSLEEKL